MENDIDVLQVQEVYYGNGQGTYHPRWVIGRSLEKQKSVL